LARFRLTVEVLGKSKSAAGSVRRPRPPSRRYARAPSAKLRRAGVLVAVLVGAGGTWNFLRPIPAVAGTISGPAQYAIAGTAPSLPWPAVGTAAVGVAGLGLIAASNDSSPAPMASVAKVMTALVLLTDKPLVKSELGPVLTITEQDVATYLADKAEQQSVVAVAVGERLNEFETLQALLVPSGNNIAETLARWDAGSVPAFVVKMNERAAALHLKRTTFADPAGVSTQTVSTASDLVVLGMAAMQQPALAEVVGFAQTTIPVAGTVYNVNAALGRSGIIGIKTGSGLNSGATFLFAATATVDGSPVTLFGCVMGQPTLDASFTAAETLIASMQGTVHVRKVVSRNDVLGAYAAPWGSRADLLATVDVTLVEWPGMILHQRLDVQTLAVDTSVAGGLPAGRLHLSLGDQQWDIPLVTGGSLDPPGPAWRVLRI
jgi:D-alanyl-D-alanine carboxypeptidase (penicillin-binding protein 5/6)